MLTWLSRAKGERNFSIVMGRDLALKTCLLSVLVAHACFLTAVFQAERTLGACALGVSLLGWIVILVPWLRRGSDYPEKAGMYRALWVWLYTDIVIGITFLKG